VVLVTLPLFEMHQEFQVFDARLHAQRRDEKPSKWIETKKERERTEIGIQTAIE